MSAPNRLERALRRGGVAERASDGGYRVWRSRNRHRRCLGRLREAVGDRLRAEGKIELIQGEMQLYVWAGPLDRHVIAPGVPPAIELPGRPARRQPRTLLARALGHEADRRARLRLADAAARFTADVEVALKGRSVTMNWSQLALGRTETSLRPVGHLPGYAGMRAKGALSDVARALGVEQTQLLDWLLIREVSATEMGRRLECAPESAVGQCAAALSGLADAYDQTVRPN